jgi:redox-sensitive bicupin YhaK (pirin superfamily)
MSIRPVKQIIQAQPTMEGAGVKLRRAFGFGKTGDFDPFLLLDDIRRIIFRDFHGTRIAASRRSRTFLQAR